MSCRYNILKLGHICLRLDCFWDSGLMHHILGISEILLPIPIHYRSSPHHGGLHHSRVPVGNSIIRHASGVFGGAQWCGIRPIISVLTCWPTIRNRPYWHILNSSLDGVLRRWVTLSSWGWITWACRLSRRNTPTISANPLLVLLLLACRAVIYIIESLLSLRIGWPSLALIRSSLSCRVKILLSSRRVVGVHVGSCSHLGSRFIGLWWLRLLSRLHTVLWLLSLKIVVRRILLLGLSQIRIRSLHVGAWAALGCPCVRVASWTRPSVWKGSWVLWLISVRLTTLHFVFSLVENIIIYN